MSDTPPNDLALSDEVACISVMQPAPMQPVPAHSRATVVVSAGTAVVWGGLVAVQSRINGELGAKLSDGFLAALISFASGLVIVGVALAVSRSGRVGVAHARDAVRSGTLPWWYLGGGFAGALFVLSQGITVATIGIALFTVAAVAGQTLSGLVIDARGIGSVGPQRVTLARAIGSAVTLIAVIVSVAPQVQTHAPLWMLLMPLIVGLLLGWQQAVNGQVKSRTGSAVAATFFNFLSGTLLLLVGAVIHTALAGLPRSLPRGPYLYLGGIIGVIFIAGFAVITPIIGVLVQSLAAVSGQLVVSLLLDFLAPTSPEAVAWTTIVGTVLALAGVAIATVPPRAKTALAVESP